MFWLCKEYYWRNEAKFFALHPSAKRGGLRRVSKFCFITPIKQLDNTGDRNPFCRPVVSRFSLVGEFDQTFFYGEKSVVFAHPDIFSGPNLNPFLPDDNRTGFGFLSVGKLNTSVLRAGIS